MSSFIILVKNNCRIFIGSLRGRKNTKTIVAVAVMGVLFAFIAFSLAMSSVTMAQVLTDAGIPDLSIYLGLVSALTLGILFGLMRSANAPVSRDADLLLSMPLRRFTIVCSKVVSQYIFDAPLMIAVFGSTIVANYVIADAGLGVLLRGILLTLLLPFLPMAISYMLGALMAILRRTFKLTGIITTGILMVLFIGYMVINFQSSSMMSGIETLDKSTELTLIERFAPLSWLTHFVIDGEAAPVLFSLLMLIIPFAAGVALFSISFGKQKDAYQSNSRVLIYKTHSPKVTLLIKETRRYLACSIYVFNTAFGPLLLLVFAIAMAVMGPDKILGLIGIPTEAQTALPQETILIILTGIFCFFPTATSTSAVSISLEGNQFWILKAHPFRTVDIFWSKYMLNMILIIPIGVFATVLVGIRMGLSIPEILGMTAAPAVLGIFVGFIGLIANLLFPRFDWTSETVVVKQSVSVMIALLTAMVVALIPFGLYYFVMQQAYGYLGLCTLCVIIYGFLSVCAYLFLQTKGKAIFESL
jgi:ABC-2 type transport system permease protein